MVTCYDGKINEKEENVKEKGTKERKASERAAGNFLHCRRRPLRRRVFAKINMSTLSNQRRASWGLIPSRGSLSGAHAARRLAAGCPSANILSHCCPALLKSPHCLTFLI